MNSELQKIDNYLSGKKYSHLTYAEMSEDNDGNPLVESQISEAYKFDTIKEDHTSPYLCSADSLLLKDNLYFIEFKRLLDASDECDFSLIKKGLFLKLCESFILLNEILVKQLNVDVNVFKKYFIIVIDSKNNPLSATSAAMDDLSKSDATKASCDTSVDTSMTDKISPSFNKYKQIYNGKPLMYDDVFVWDDLNFESKVKTLL